MSLSKFEALSKLAHRVAISENERKDLEAAFLEHFGSDEEKQRLYQETEADKAEREAKERFDAAVAAEVAKRQKAAADAKKAEEEAAAVQAAADAQAGS